MTVLGKNGRGGGSEGLGLTVYNGE